MPWLELELGDSDRAKEAASAEAIRRYEAELSRCRGRLNLLYEDRLDERIDLATYDHKAQEIRQQETRLRQKIDELQPTPAQSSAGRPDLATLVSGTGKTLLSQSATEQRRLFQILLQDASWKSGVLSMSFREPFATLCNPR